MPVFTTVAPLSWFISSVAGEAASISILVPAGADAHVYEPKPEQMTALSSAVIYFAIGNFSPFEASRLPKLADQAPALKIVNLNEGLDDEPREEDDEHGHDPHIWTSVSSAPKILLNVLNAFAEVDPENASLYNENYLRALDEIRRLDAHIKNKFRDCGGKSFFVYHPAWGRFAEEYGIYQIAVEHEGKEPKINMLAALIDTAREKDIKTIFAAPSDPKRNVRIFADEIGADVVIIDPLAHDWLLNMYRVAEEIYEALR
ncbi:MAG: zinc ABC transporter substrate-binding protein [Synergistaceae bacterium]|nr:zinc ABC transporter substrate-binding protein [Synergistaceae bacterium]